jgi:hypothetical protein
MKKLIVAAAVALTAIGALAQGQLNVGNRVTTAGIDAPVFKADGVTRLDGAAFLAQAYVGLTETSLAPVGAALPFRTGAAAGYITSTGVSVTGLPGGTAVLVQLRAWEAAKGATYEAAVAGGGLYGSSKPVNVNLSSPPAAPADMVGLQSFALVPEPSTLALGVLGVAALLLRRRS